MTNLHSLEKVELIRQLQASQEALASDAREEKRLLHNLQVHQIELELQNRNLRESQQELELSRDRYADLYDFAPVGYLTLHQGIITESNLTVSTMLGVPRQELTGRPLGVYITQESKPVFYDYMKRLREFGGNNIVTEIVLQCREADPRHVRLVSTCAVSGQNEPICRTVMVDITEPRRLAAQLQLANNALESIPEGIMVTDCEHQIILVNPAFSIITGYSKSEAIGQKMNMLKSGLQESVLYDSLRRQLENAGKWEGEIWNRRKNGEIYPEWLLLSEIRTPSGLLTHYVGVFNDITSQAKPFSKGVALP